MWKEMSTLRTQQLRLVWYKSSCKQSDYATNYQCIFMGHWLQHKNDPQKLVFAPIPDWELIWHNYVYLFAFLLDWFPYLTHWYSNVCTIQWQQAGRGLVMSTRSHCYTKQTHERFNIFLGFVLIHLSSNWVQNRVSQRTYVVTTMNCGARVWQRLTS